MLEFDVTFEVITAESAEHGNDTLVDYEAAVNLMDDDIREAIHAAMAPCTEQAFLDAYAAAHEAKFDEEFIVN